MQFAFFSSASCESRSLLTQSTAVFSAATHRRRRLPPLRGADESEILGLVSTEWSRSVLCHHRYVVWRCCEGQEQSFVNQFPNTLDRHSALARAPSAAKERHTSGSRLPGARVSRTRLRRWKSHTSRIASLLLSLSRDPSKYVTVL